jgi:hypothetical protein
MRDPRDVVQGRIEAEVKGRAGSAQINAQNKARQAVNKAVSNTAQKAKGGGAPKPEKKKGWWPFGRKEAAAEAPACGSCGKEVDASWEVCPYCGTGLGAPKAPAGRPTMMPPGGAPVPAAPPPSGGPMIAGNKTVAIDIEQLKGPKRELVGWLVVMSGNQKGLDFRIFAGKNSLGAAADNDIVITDDYLSSRHAVIRYEDGKYELVDNESTNGTYVNEKKVTREELIDNDTLRLGRTELRFKALY